MKPTRVILHHSGDAATGAQFDKINQWHKEKGFPKSKLNYYVGYHYVIERDGRTRQARVETEIGAHDAGENWGSLGICLVGDFNKERPTEQQAAAAASLFGAIRNRHNIYLGRVENHRIDDTTDCPGANIPDNWLVDQWLSRETSAPLRVLYYLLKQFNLI